MESEGNDYKKDSTFMSKEEKIQELITDWATNSRWSGIERPYSAEKVVALQGSYRIAHSIASHGAEILWHKLNIEQKVILENILVMAISGEKVTVILNENQK